MRRLLTILIFIHTVGLPAQRPPVPGDLLLSELLFNPLGDGVDFVEIYNASHDSILLDRLQLINARGTTRTLTTDYVLSPSDYLVLTEDPQDIALSFANVDTSRVLILDLPSLPNESGSIQLVSGVGQLLDAFAYDADLHGELIDPEGVSLERRRFDVPTETSGNWFSATSAVGYGTPTRPNSQAQTERVAKPELELIETAFYPTSAGLPNTAAIAYRTDQPGYLAQLSVFNTSGEAVVNRPRTELIGTDGTLIWDGRDTHGTLQAAGPYVLLINLFHPDGHTATFKLVAVLSS